MEKLISVIMSTKDTDEIMLRQSIDSILKQTYKNFEFIIVCDGGTTDYNIVKSYNDNRIIIIKHEKPLGLTKSLNEALNIAKGEYIARMDSDDISLKKRFMIQIKFMEKRNDIDICSTMVKKIGMSQQINVNLYNDSEGIKAQLFLYNCLAHPTIMIRKKFIDDNNILYDEKFRYSQDYELWSRCSKIGRLCVINKICLLYRMHSNQISTAKLSEQNKLCKFIYERNLEELKIENIDKYANILLFISGRKENEYTEEEVSNAINHILEINRSNLKYDQKKLAKVLYFRLFMLFLKEKHKFLSIKIILKHNLLGLAVKKMILNNYYKIKWLFQKKLNERRIKNEIY